MTGNGSGLEIPYHLPLHNGLGNRDFGCYWANSKCLQAGIADCGYPLGFSGSVPN